MIRRVRYAALAFVVLGILGAATAIDWSAPSRAPIAAIELHPAPPQAAARPQAPKVIQKGKHGGRETIRNAGAALRNRLVGSTSSSVSTPSSVVAASATGNASGTDGDDGEDRQTVSRPTTTPAAPPREDDGDEPAGTTTTTTADPAPVPPPEIAGDPADDDDDDEDDDDDDGGEDDGGGDDDEDDG